MAIRDRGKKKWQFAYGMPELIKAQREMWHDTERIGKPIIDEHEAEEFNLRIMYAMEYGHSVKLSVWDDGFTSEMTGLVHYVDLMTKELRIEVKAGEFERVVLDSVVGVKVVG